MISRATCPQDYLDAVKAENADRNVRNLEFELGFLFDGVPLRGRSVLEIGGGAGILSYYAASMGATRVVCLEPEADGGTAGIRQRFRQLGQRLRLDSVRLEPTTLQRFDAAGATFDVVVVHDAVNHLDEEACISLTYSSESRLRYVDLFRKIAALTRPGGNLVVADCSRYNLFGMLGLRSPLAPTIEWHKHQAPKTWAALLEAVGFERPRIRWSSFNTLRWPGQLLFGNAVAAFALTSHFCLTMSRR
jgi:2-polyprenyl-3-methyl-5-hydroxy-6-metoxy-1,4-benzoquinol methylase